MTASVCARQSHRRLGGARRSSIPRRILDGQCEMKDASKMRERPAGRDKSQQYRNVGFAPAGFMDLRRGGARDPRAQTEPRAENKAGSHEDTFWVVMAAELLGAALRGQAPSIPPGVRLGITSRRHRVVWPVGPTRLSSPERPSSQRGQRDRYCSCASALSSYRPVQQAAQARCPLPGHLRRVTSERRASRAARRRRRGNGRKAGGGTSKASGTCARSSGLVCAAAGT